MESLYAVAIFNYLEGRLIQKVLMAKNERDAIEQIVLLDCPTEDSKEDMKQFMSEIEGGQVELIDKLNGCELIVSSPIKISSL